MMTYCLMSTGEKCFETSKRGSKYWEILVLKGFH